MNCRYRSLSISVMLVLATLAPVALAIPGVDLAMRKTRHFELLIDATKTRRLDSLAPLAEAMWERLAATTGYRPKDAIRVVFHDEDDYANGWALATNNWVNVWLTPTPFELRGGVDWLQDVLSHELAHVFTLKALKRDGYLVSVGWVGAMERVHFSGAADLEWRPNDLEAWLAEGLAQIGAESCRSDSWDAHRDMLEHVAWKTGRILPDGLLRDYWGDARESEQIYNQGYSFLRWVLLEGTSDFPTLLRLGARNGLRRAVEASVGKPFPQAYAAWKDRLGARHGTSTWPVEAGRGIGALDKAGTWVSEPSVVGDSSGRTWVVSSRSNDAGIGSLWEFKGKRTRKLSADAVGRLHLSPSGDRLAVLLQETWPDRRTIRDLWIYRPDVSGWDRITTRGRVQDADFHPSGFVAIVRRDGWNQAVILSSDGALGKRLPRLTNSDLVQVASRPDGRIVATSMGTEGFRLILASDSGWKPLPGIDGEARDPSFADGRLWYSRRDGSGRWVACSQADGGGSIVEATSEGGVFAPFPVSTDSMLVSRYQREGFVATMVPRRDIGSLTPIPAALPVPTVAGAPEPKDVAIRAGKAMEAISLVGYGLQAGFISQRNSSQRFNPGDKWITAAGAYATNSSMETTFEAGVEILHGGPGQKSGWDKGVSLVASTETWSPQITVGFSTLQTTLEQQGSDTLVDSLFVGDTLPFAMQTDLSLQVVQMLRGHSYLFGVVDRQTLGVGVRRVTGEYSLDLQKSTQVLLGWGGDWSEPGRWGTLSGIGLGISGGRLWNQVPEEIGTLPDAWAMQARTVLNTNIHRRILLELDVQAVLLRPDGADPIASSTVGAMVGVPLPIPAFGMPLSRNRGWTFVDPILRIGHAATFERESSGLDGFHRMDLARRVSSRWRGGSFDGIRLFDPLRASDEVRFLQVGDAELAWKVVNLANVATLWSVGAELPSFDSDLWRRIRWRASISL